jgi:hypothetical protein
MRLREILRETAEEIREIEAIAGLVADYLAKLQQSREPWRIFRALPLKQVVQPRFQNAAVNAVVKNVWVQVDGQMKPQNLGSWSRSENRIQINASLIKPELDRPELINTLAHELTHAMDTHKGIAFRGQANIHDGGIGDQEYQHYLRLQHEIDARLTEALVSLAQEIKKFQDIDELFGQPGQEARSQDILWRAIQQVFARSRITELYPQGTRDPRYRRLLSRAYKFYATPQAVAQATQPTLIQRALAWLKAR